MPPACTARAEEGEQAQDRGLGHMPPWTHPPGSNRLVRCHLQEAFPDSTPQALLPEIPVHGMPFPLWTVEPFRVELSHIDSAHITQGEELRSPELSWDLHPPEDTHIQVPVAPSPPPTGQDHHCGDLLTHRSLRSELTLQATLVRPKCAPPASAGVTHPCSTHSAVGGHRRLLKAGTRRLKGTETVGRVEARPHAKVQGSIGISPDLHLTISPAVSSPGPSSSLRCPCRELCTCPFSFKIIQKAEKSEQI